MNPEERKAALVKLHTLRKELSVALNEKNAAVVKEKYEARKAIFSTLKAARKD